jgi:hypothetical protein
MSQTERAQRMRNQLLERGHQAEPERRARHTEKAFSRGQMEIVNIRKAE